jgi:hypothetical protein
VRGALEPYTRFVRSERAKVEERASILAKSRERLMMLKREIESILLAR